MDINTIQELVEKDGIVFLSYGGVLTQSLISAMTEALEKETANHDLNMSISSNIFTVFIELSQNMMNYSKSKNIGCRLITPGGLIIVSKDKDGTYYIHSQNIVSIEDKERIEPKLEEIISLDRDGIKKRYRELRRNGEHSHEKGGGIGFYEIGKRCDSIEYKFQNINEDKYYFYIKTTIKKIKK